MVSSLSSALEASLPDSLAVTLQDWLERIEAHPDLRFDSGARQFVGQIVYFLLQKKVVEPATIPSARAPRFVKWVGSRYHVIIFWGFLLITVGTVDVLVSGVFPSSSRRRSSRRNRISVRAS